MLKELMNTPPPQKEPIKAGKKAAKKKVEPKIGQWGLTLAEETLITKALSTLTKANPGTPITVKLSASLYAPQISIRLSGVTTGCGLGQVSGVIGIIAKNEEKNKELCFELRKHMKTSNYGAVFATLGKNYWPTNHEPLIKMGFKQIAEYHNPSYPEDYMQRMYLLTLE